MQNSTAEISPDVFGQALTQLPCGVLLSDNDKLITWCNDVISEWTECSVQQMMSKPVDTILTEYLAPPDENNQLIHIKTTASQTEKWLKRQDIALDNGAGITLTLLWDVTNEQSKRQKCANLSNQLEQLNTVDPVTGLFNRKAMLQNIEPMVSRCRRYENPLSVIAMEFANFKDIVDEYGQGVANQSFIALAQLLRDQIRWSDIVSRPDETRIIFILPETENSDASHLAHKIMHQISEMEIKTDSPTALHIEANIGVASWEKGYDALLLLRSANQKLADAIKKGPGSVLP